MRTSTTVVGAGGVRQTPAMHAWPGVVQSAGPRQAPGTQRSATQSKPLGQLSAVQRAAGWQNPPAQNASAAQPRSPTQRGSCSHSPFAAHVKFAGHVLGPAGSPGAKASQRPRPRSSPAQRWFGPRAAHSASVVHSAGRQRFCSQMRPAGQVLSPKQRATHSPLAVSQAKRPLPQSSLAMHGAPQVPRWQR
jgi:hypothetical protein